MFDIKKYFKGNYKLTTPDNRLNYKGVTLKYFEKEFFGDGRVYLEETLKTYAEQYENKIFLYFNDNIAVDDIPEEHYSDIEQRLMVDFQLSDVTIEHTQHSLITRLVEQYFDDPNTIAKSPFKGSSSNFIKKHKNRNIDEIILKIPKSLSIEQFDLAFDTLIKDPKTENGAYPALGAICCTGIRLNEAAGASFKSILNLLNYCECYYITIIETSELNSRTIKTLGKSFNAQRRLLLIQRFKEYLHERMEFLKTKFDFPTYDNVGNLIESVEDLPLGCIGNKYNYRFGSVYLSKEGKEFLMNVVKVNEDSLGAIETQIKTNNDYAEYKDATTYLFRRNWLTNLRILGFTEEQLEYWAGHAMDDSNYSRGMFGNEDNLYNMFEIISKHPINKQDLTKRIKINDVFTEVENESSVELIFDSNDEYVINIIERELNDGVEIRGEVSDSDASVSSIPHSRKPNETTNITRQLNDEYTKVRNKRNK